MGLFQYDWRYVGAGASSFSPGAAELREGFSWLLLSV
jgi:hypothetical protein